ncbi:MAG: hypothetical protein K6E70_03420 [Butyrivibrio sp.]|nr:hypothetical protein [Butyrivibrio sp.]
MRKKLLSFFMAILLTLSILMPAKLVARAEIPELKGTAKLEDISKYGNIRS